MLRVSQQQRDPTDRMAPKAFSGYEDSQEPPVFLLDFDPPYSLCSIDDLPDLCSFKSGRDIPAQECLQFLLQTLHGGLQEDFLCCLFLL